MAQDDFVQPEDIEKGGLNYVWVANAEPAQLTIDGDKVIHQMPTGVREYEPALLGKSSQDSSNGVGIYTVD